MAERPARVAPALAETDFGRAVSVAVAGSPGLTRSGAALDEARAQVLVERADRLPRFSLSLSLPVGGGGYVPALGLSQLVFDAGAGASRERAAEAAVLGRVAGRMEVASASALDAVEAWASVVTARRALAATAATEAALRRLTDQIAERAAAGAGSSTDILTARSRLENLRAEAADIRAALARAEAVYAEIFGRAPAGGIGLPPRPPAPADLSAEGSPALFVAQAAELAAAADLTAAQAGRAPAVTLGGSLSEGGATSARLDSDQSLSPGGARAARVAAAEARLAARAADTEATRREIDRTLTVLRAEALAARGRLAAARRAAEVNRENLTASREQFEIARRSLIELLDAEREALAAERQRIGAEHDDAILGYALLAATGDILDLFGIALGPPPVTQPDGTAG